MRSKVLIITTVIGALALIGLGYLYFKSRNIEYVHPRRGNIIEAVYGQGKVKTDKLYELKLGVLSTAEKLYVVEGESVSKGDSLLKLDSGLILKAPFTGIVSYIAFHENENLPVGMTLIRIESEADRYLEVSLEQQGALRVRPGLNAKVIFESLRNEQYQGMVSSVYSREDEFIARIRIENLGPGILSGMTADVAIVVGELSDALLIPLSSIHNGKVTVRRKGKKLREKVSIKIGKVDSSWAEVLEGDLLLEDEVLIPKVSK